MAEQMIVEMRQQIGEGSRRMNSRKFPDMEKTAAGEPSPSSSSSVRQRRRVAVGGEKKNDPAKAGSNGTKDAVAAAASQQRNQQRHHQIAVSPCFSGRETYTFHDWAHLLHEYETFSREDKDRFARDLRDCVGDIELDFCRGNVQKYHNKDLFRFLGYGAGENLDHIKLTMAKRLRDYGFADVDPIRFDDKFMIRRIPEWYRYAANEECVWSRPDLPLTEMKELLQRGGLLDGRMCYVCTVGFLRLNRQGMCPDICCTGGTSGSVVIVGTGTGGGEKRALENDTASPAAFGNTAKRRRRLGSNEKKSRNGNGNTSSVNAAAAAATTAAIVSSMPNLEPSFSLPTEKAMIANPPRPVLREVFGEYSDLSESSEDDEDDEDDDDFVEVEKAVGNTITTTMSAPTKSAAVPQQRHSSLTGGERGGGVGERRKKTSSRGSQSRSQNAISAIKN